MLKLIALCSVLAGHRRCHGNGFVSELRKELMGQDLNRDTGEKVLEPRRDVMREML